MYQSLGLVKTIVICFLAGMAIYTIYVLLLLKYVCLLFAGQVAGACVGNVTTFTPMTGKQLQFKGQTVRTNHLILH